MADETLETGTPPVETSNLETQTTETPPVEAKPPTPEEVWNKERQQIQQNQANERKAREALEAQNRELSTKLDLLLDLQTRKADPTQSPTEHQAAVNEYDEAVKEINATVDALGLKDLAAPVTRALNALRDAAAKKLDRDDPTLQAVPQLRQRIEASDAMTIWRQDFAAANPDIPVAEAEKLAATIRKEIASDPTILPNERTGAEKMAFNLRLQSLKPAAKPGITSAAPPTTAPAPGASAPSGARVIPAASGARPAVLQKADVAKRMGKALFSAAPTR